VTANDPRDSRQPQLMRKHLTAQSSSRKVISGLSRQPP
jgi:hypothetical protein